MLTVSSQTGSSPKKKPNKKLQSLYFFHFSVIREMLYVHRVHLSKFKSHVIRAYLRISEISPFSLHQSTFSFRRQSLFPEMPSVCFWIVLSL